MSLKRSLHSVDPEDQSRYHDLDATRPCRRLHPRYSHSDTNFLSPQQQQSAYICDQAPTCHRQPLTFNSQSSYEAHYNMYHAHSCVECPATFPCDHYLNLHITEHHDPFTILRKERGCNIYGCLINECPVVSKDPSERRLHMIHNHNFPKDFRFSVISQGISEGQISMLNSR